LSAERAALVAYRLERARESLEEAALLLAAGRGNAAVNRLYYACFYAVAAALLARGLSSPKHAGVRSLFHRHLVKPGTVPAERGKFFDLLFNSRQKGDYADFVRFDPDDVRPWVEKAREFVASMEALARPEGADGAGS
jgi:uncharacterized protein (UPF0332 family)